MKLIFIILLLQLHRTFAEPITIGLSLLAGAAISYFYGTSVNEVGKYAACKTGLAYYSGQMECCQIPWIKNDVAGLRRDLDRHLFGQHIVVEMVPSAISASTGDIVPTKPLVMSFHGWPGNGKNYVSSFIAKHQFAHGEHSNFYHVFNGRKDFGLENETHIYQRQLSDWIKGNVTICPRSLFIFDEVDKMPSKVLDSIKPFLDHHEQFQGVDYRRSIFIFLSNTGGTIITARYLELWRKYGKTREQMTLNDFDSVIGKGAFNEIGGLQMSDLVEHNIIDHYVPFLPLEQHHVEMCIKADLDKFGFPHKKEIIDEIMQVVTFGPKPENLFSNTGCKRLSQQVATIVHREKMKNYAQSRSNEF